MRVTAISAEEYPDLPEYDSENKIILPQGLLKSMIRQTAYAVSINDAKPILTGELFDIGEGSFNLVAIDGFRMAIRTEKIDTPDTYKFVVPSRALNETARLLKDDKDLNCAIYPARRHIVFDINGYLLFSRLLEGEFHNYRVSLPDKFRTEIVLRTKETTDCLERCSLLISEKNKSPIRCLFNPQKPEIRCSTTAGKLCEDIDAEITGESLEIGLNSRFLLEALRASECDKIKLQTNGAKMPIKILPIEGNSFTFLLMPVQLRNE